MKPYRLFGLLTILVLIIIAVPMSSVGAAACTVTLNPGDDIQTAINASSPGDVICLNTGLYSPPATININESITLQGPQGGIDPRPSAGSARTPGNTASEAIIDGMASNLSGIILITTDNVVLDGLEIRNGKVDMVYSLTASPISNLVLKNNILDGAINDEAIQIRACTDCVIEFNHIFDIAQDGINMCCDSTGGAIRFNEVYDNHSENAAIYMYDATNMTVQCNLVYDVYGNDGIKLGDKGGGDSALSGGSILNNVVHSTNQDGISVYTSDVVIEGNEVYNSTSENGAIYVAQAVSNITIENNFVHDNTLQIFKWGNPGAIHIGTAVNAGTVFIHNNNILNNSPNGITNKAAALLDATSNWWGAADGPSGEGFGSGDAVSSNVDFDPWLTDAVVIPNACVLDNEGPITTEVVADPNPAAVGSSVLVTANVDDTTTGNSNIDSADYEIYDGYDALVGSGSMLPVDAFDSPIEDVTTSINAPTTAGIYDLCVYGTDAAGNVGDSECIMFVVYDPSGGFVTGGGWIDSPAGAIAPVEKIVFFNGFETDIEGWITPPTRVMSGNNGVPSAAGGYHAEAVAGNFTRWGGYNSVFPTGGFLTAIDIYLNMDAVYANDTRFDWSSAINAPDGNHRRDFIFTGGFYNDATGPGAGQNRFVFSASNNSPGWPKNPDRDPFAVTTTGWYTLQHYFYESGAGVLAVDMSILDGTGSVLHTWTLSNPTDIIGTTVGGNRYGWFVTNGFPFLAIDNSVRKEFSNITGKATFGFVSKYKKGASVPEGNTQFQFQAGDLNFHSTSYEWLVVTGSNYAKFKGAGTINGQGDYKFQLWAGDGTSLNGLDTFRIKIWYEENGSEVVVYDNGMDQEIGGGSIVVHKAK